MKEVQHGHTHVLTKYDQGQEGLSFVKQKYDFKIENTNRGEILSENVVGDGVCAREGPGGGGEE